MPRKDAILKIRLAEDLKAEVEAVADSTGETVAVIVRQALRDYIDRRRASSGSRAKQAEQPQRTDYYSPAPPALKVAEQGKMESLHASDAKPGGPFPTDNGEGAA
jgi:hypothetical protein